MNAERKVEIERLARESFRALEKLRQLGYLNTSGLPPEEAEQQAVEYAIALAEASEAKTALDRAINSNTTWP